VSTENKIFEGGRAGSLRQGGGRGGRSDIYTHTHTRTHTRTHARTHARAQVVNIREFFLPDHFSAQKIRKQKQNSVQDKKKYTLFFF
jgi:hypothetical protein